MKHDAISRALLESKIDALEMAKAKIDELIEMYRGILADEST